jgi:ketol-acid reductoisomerase
LPELFIVRLSEGDSNANAQWRSSQSGPQIIQNSRERHQKVPKLSRKGSIAERSFLKRNENAVEFRRVRQGVLEGDPASIGVFFNLIKAGIDRVDNDGESRFHRKVGTL